MPMSAVACRGGPTRARQCRSGHRQACQRCLSLAETTGSDQELHQPFAFKQPPRVGEVLPPPLSTLASAPWSVSYPSRGPGDRVGRCVSAMCYSRQLYHASSASNVLASWRSAVSQPSVSQLYTQHCHPLALTRAWQLDEC